MLAVVGPTASGKSAKAVELAHAHGGEIISVDSRQVYRTLDIGTEKVTTEEMRGIPHHLIDIREPEESYSAGSFVEDALHLIGDMHARNVVPILAGGTHFYFDALLSGLPDKIPPNPALRSELELLDAEELFAQLQASDPHRAEHIDPLNKRRLVRALEIVAMHGSVPLRTTPTLPFTIEWVVVDHPKEVLRERIDGRLQSALDRGLINEVRQVRERTGDERLREFGLEYRVIGEYLRGERDEESLLPALSSKLWHFARHQKAWLRKLGVAASDG